MNMDVRATWSKTGLRGLLTSYFGDRLETALLDQLIANTVEALADRGRTVPLFHASDRGGHVDVPTAEVRG